METMALSLAAAWGMALLTTPLVRKLAFKVGAVDQPNHRKVHARVMPRMGGVAIYLAFAALALLTQGERPEVWGLILSGGIIVATGCLDDIMEISPKVKLLGQILAALVLMAFGVKVSVITNPIDGGVIFLDWWAYPITLLWLVGVSNAVNLIDGLDGLAAGTSAIGAVTLGIVAWQQDPAVAILAWLLAAAILGFMKYNFHPASIFMGDAGSLFLGFALAALSIMGVAKGAFVMSVFVPILLVGVPVLDTTFAIVRRMANGKPIFQADKAHLHHRLMALGLSHKQAVLAIYLIHGLFSLAGIVVSLLPAHLGWLVLGVLTMLAFAGGRWIGVIGRRGLEVHHQ